MKGIINSLWNYKPPHTNSLTYYIAKISMTSSINDNNNDIDVDEKTESSTNEIVNRPNLHTTMNGNGFKIPLNYNWNESTAKTYSSHTIQHPFIKYKKSKSQIDDKYHGYYTQLRQKYVHNKIIESFCQLKNNNNNNNIKFKNNQWLIFTAGPFGSGKTHTLKWLASKNYFSLNSFVNISPDYIKKFLPEYEYYIKNSNKNIGQLLRQEVGYLCEIIVWELLQTNKCLWYDSSLRHGIFFKNLFNKINILYPNYKIGIINVKANDKTIF